MDLALEDSDQGRGKAVVEELVEEPYVQHRQGEGYGIVNHPDGQAQAAVRLQSSCGYLKLQIEATLSRFEQAGGFDAYDDGEVLAKLDEWE